MDKIKEIADKADMIVNGYAFTRENNQIRIVYAYMNDGSVRKFDVKPLIKKGGVFKKIEDKEIFKNTLTVLNGTVAWDIAGNRNIYKCIDIDPMTIFKSPAVPDFPEI